MNNVIIFTNAQGGTTVVYPAPNCGLTIQEIAAKDMPAGTPHAIVDESQVPSDHTYFNAFVADLQAGVVAVDMPKAREIHKNFMRAARTPILAALDVAYTRADEKGPAGAAEKAQIAAQKQALRDVTADAGIAAATTPEELKAVWPAVLGPKPYGGV